MGSVHLVGESYKVITQNQGIRVAARCAVLSFSCKEEKNGFCVRF